jgi:hypothetical protein
VQCEANWLAFGARIGVLMTWVPSDVNTSSKARVIAVTVTNEEPRRAGFARPFCLSVHRELSCSLDDP